ncbi:MAG: hypothetical protein IJU16_04000 [Clostridia bacterium]|nr:hypothetical protein [Clostridia bacterium]
MALCTAGIGCAILRMVAPSGTLQRMLNLLTSLFLLICILLPLLSLPSLFKYGDYEQYLSWQDQKTYADEQARSLVDVQLLQAAQSAAAPFSVTVEKVMDMGDHIQVWIDCKNRLELSDMSAVLKRVFGAQTEVIVIGE